MMIQLDVDDLNKVEYFIANLKKGECVYVPNSKWSYALKTPSVWLFSIVWDSFNETVTRESCNPNNITFSSLSNNLYLHELTQPKANIENL